LPGGAPRTGLIPVGPKYFVDWPRSRQGEVSRQTHLRKAILNYTLEQFGNDGRRTGRKIDGKQ